MITVYEVPQAPAAHLPLVKKKMLASPVNDANEAYEDVQSIISANTFEGVTSGSEAEYVAFIRVGSDYQATIPDFRKDSRCFREDLGVPLWKPTTSLSDDQLKTYIDFADKRWVIGEEKALSLLYFREHNLEVAKQDCRTFASRPSDWFEEEELLFSKVLRLESKRFPRIQRWLANRSVGDLVEYYYRIHKPKVLREKRNVGNTKEAGSSTNGTASNNNNVQNAVKKCTNILRTRAIKRKRRDPKSVTNGAATSNRSESARNNKTPHGSTSAKISRPLAHARRRVASSTFTKRSKPVGLKNESKRVAEPPEVLRKQTDYMLNMQSEALHISTTESQSNTDSTSAYNSRRAHGYQVDFSDDEQLVFSANETDSNDETEVAAPCSLLQVDGTGAKIKIKKRLHSIIRAQTCVKVKKLSSASQQF